jgi:hypothetical protein
VLFIITRIILTNHQSNSCIINKIAMSSLSQTQCFDSSICSTPETRQMHNKACQNSQNSEKCLQGMQQFCQTQIHTNQEFQLQKDVLSCVSQCGIDKKCILQCAQR